jgi:hypothetical protein
MPTLTLYANPNLSGKSASWLHAPDPYKPPPDWRYRSIKREVLKANSLDNSASSLRLANGTETPMTVVLFDEDQAGTIDFGWGPATTIPFALPHLQGSFRAFAAGTTRDVANLADYGFNDKTSSALMLRHSPNEFLPVSLADLAREDATATVKDALKDVEEASLRGQLAFGWEMWPEFDGAKTFIRITIPLTIDVPNWPADYKAAIHYYVFLFIDAAGRLRGYANWCKVWVEGGTFTNSILWRLKGEAQKAMPVIDAQLNSFLSEMDFHQWQSYYYMPGSAPLVRPGDYAGSTYDDVTIILVRKPGSPF